MSILHYIYCLPLANVIAIMGIGIFMWSPLVFIFKEDFWSKVNKIGAIVAFLAIIVTTVAFRHGGGDTSVVLMPFQSFQEAKIQPEIYRTLVMNCFLFYPLGITLPFALGKMKYKGCIAVLIALVLSVLIEVIQHIFGLGRAETDDVIFNVLGVIVGMIPYFFSSVFMLVQKNKEKQVPASPLKAY